MVKQSKFKKILFICLFVFALLLLSLALFLKSPLFKVSHTTTEMHYEIGDTLKTSPSNFLSGEDWCVALSYVDASSVKKTKAGRYPIYIYHGFEKYTTYVNVIDTTPPVVTCDIKNKTITTGEIISVHSLGLNIEDHSEIESILFTKISSDHFYTGLPKEIVADMEEAYRKGLSMQAEEFQFAYGGVYTLTISVTDAFYNRSEITLNLTVEQPPVIEVPSDFYVAAYSSFDFADYITAWDFIDEDFDTSDVVIDTMQLNLGKSGVYEILFTARDSYGLSSQVLANVHVTTQDELQKLINTHEISVSDHAIIGAHNPYDIGYYEDTSLSDIQSLMLPAIVHIENDKLDSWGSGYIIEISDDFITIATNEHVINNDLIVDVTFSNAKQYEGSVVASNAREDIAFVRIPIGEEENASSYPKEYIDELRTVHIDSEYWNNLSNDSDIAFCYNCIDANAEVWLSNDGTILEKIATRDWNSYKDINETILSTDPVSGSSGSALFNEHGIFIGMIRGYTDYENYTETVAVPLSEILDYFELVFKYRIEYK